CAANTACTSAACAGATLRRVALVGNPNVGKSTLFNVLTGMHQRIGNFPGVTVERKLGRLRGRRPVEIIDLPGLYSLDARSMDERIAVDVLKGSRSDERPPDLVACVVDATNLERNLVLALEVADLGLPTILVLNMTDVARNEGQEIDTHLLSRASGLPAVAVSATRAQGIPELVAALSGPLPPSLPPAHRTSAFERARDIAATVLEGREPEGSRVSDRFDAVLTHRIAGPVIFLGILFIIFQAIFAWATPLMDLIERAIPALSGGARGILPNGAVADLIADGVIAGVGAVLVFLPQILLLFLFIGLLEDSGYMARAAFISDRLMHRMGLSGQSIIPLVSGYACAVPAIMATRTIPNHRDRLVTMLVVPLMSCSARLPIYALLIGALIPATMSVGPFSGQGVVLFALYLVSTGVALGVAHVLKRHLMPGSTPLFAMELPRYRLPHARDLGHRVAERGWAFVSQAGGIILLMTILLWFLASYPKVDNANTMQVVDTTYAGSSVAEQPDDALQIRQSYIGRIGLFLEPTMRPLGFDWKMTAGIITAFAARETLVSTLATLYSVSDADDSATLTERMRADRDPETGRPLFTPLVAVSLLVFFMLACQCMSTLAVIRRETGTWRWPVLAWLYMTGLAYAASFIVYQGGRMIGLS
ncbi:MAG: ferrous iron transport protein B, partial [Bacteroidota bacterium]